MNHRDSFRAFARVRAAIDKEIAVRRQELQNLTAKYVLKRDHITEALRKLYKRRNDLPPVSHLPPELLSYIFLLDAISFADSGSQSCVSPLGWIHVLWVCQYWRSVAISMPQLWAQVSPTRMSYVEIALQRSAGLPLTIQSLPDSDCPLSEHPLGIYQMLQREIHRIRAVDFTVTNQVLPSLRALKLVTSYSCAPMLEELRLRCSTWNLGRSRSVRLMSLQMPRLRSLTISNGSTSLASALARPTVTSLDLSFANFYVQPNSLLDLLDGLPLLEHLTLRNLYSAVLEAFPPVDTRTILLPHLSSVRLHGTTGLRMAHLLQHLSFSDETCVTLEGIDMQGDDETYEVILPLVISQVFGGHPPIRCSSTQLRPSAMAIDAMDFRLRLWGPSPSTQDLDDKAFIQRTPRLKFSSYGNSVARPTLSFLHSLDLSVLSVLHLKPHSMSMNYWVGVFRNITLPRLEQLSFSDSSAGCLAVFKALRIPLPGVSISFEAAHSEERITLKEPHLFPNLKTLKIDDVYEGHVDELLRDMSIFLQHYATAGMKLKTLEINIPWHLAPEGLVDATLRDVGMYTLAESVRISDASGVLKA